MHAKTLTASPVQQAEIRSALTSKVFDTSEGKVIDVEIGTFVIHLTPHRGSILNGGKKSTEVSVSLKGNKSPFVLDFLLADIEAAGVDKSGKEIKIGHSGKSNTRLLFDGLAPSKVSFSFKVALGSKQGSKTVESTGGSNIEIPPDVLDNIGSDDSGAADIFSLLDEGDGKDDSSLSGQAVKTFELSIDQCLPGARIDIPGRNGLARRILCVVDREAMGKEPLIHYDVMNGTGASSSVSACTFSQLRDEAAKLKVGKGFAQGHQSLDCSLEGVTLGNLDVGAYFGGEIVTRLLAKQGLPDDEVANSVGCVVAQRAGSETVQAKTTLLIFRARGGEGARVLLVECKKPEILGGEGLIAWAKMPVEELNWKPVVDKLRSAGPKS